MEVDDQNTSGAAVDSDPDPIVASYSVFANRRPPPNRKLLILQHPNKQGPAAEGFPALNEVRLKAVSGMIEVDVPLSYQHNDYDRDKGIKWGGALQKSVAAKNGGSHGLAGGFGVGVPPMRGGRRRAAGEDDWEPATESWSEAVRMDRVLRTQTLGGQVAKESESDCQWMIGVFQDDQLHLTPAASLIQLRPQLHHLDAFSEQERLNRPREGGPSVTGAAAKEGTAKAIHMTIKSTDKGGETTLETMTDRLRKVQTEPWNRLKYQNEESADSWNLYDEWLLYDGAPSTGEADKEADKEGDKQPDGAQDKGKGKEPATAEPDAKPLQSPWDEQQFLRAISGMKGQGLEPEGPKPLNIKGDDDQDVGIVKKEDVELGIVGARGVAAAKAKAKMAPVAAPKRAGKAKVVGSRGAAPVEID